MNAGPEITEIDPNLLQVKRLAEPIRLAAEKYYKDQARLTAERQKELRTSANDLGHFLYDKAADQTTMEAAARELGLRKDVRTTPQGETYHETYPGTNLMYLFDQLIYNPKEHCYYPRVAQAFVLAAVLGMEPNQSFVTLQKIAESQDPKVEHIRKYTVNYLDKKHAMSPLNWLLKKLPQISESAVRINLAMKAFNA